MGEEGVGRGWGKELVNHLKNNFFVHDGIENSVEDYSSSSVGVVCRVVSSVSNLKDGIFSKRFELEG